MNSSAMLRICPKLLALALLAAVSTGFDTAEPAPGSQLTPKDAPGFELQQKAPESPPRPPVSAPDSTLPRDKEQEPNPIDKKGPDAAVAKKGLTPENVLSWETG